MDEVSILSEFLCGNTPLFPGDDVLKLKTQTDGLYKTYTFTCKGNAAVLSKLVGSDVYVLVGALSVDDTLTEYSEVTCMYVLTDNGDESVLVSRSLSFTIHAYSELPYIAGQNINKKDYLTNIHIDCSQTYTQFGSCDVVLPDASEYKPYGNENSESGSV
ncbi:MAG TPA: hypothetical protein PLT66_08425 [Bacillota bacterium]|nr:hypothetical protein [Bacillota bacterium]